MTVNDPSKIHMDCLETIRTCSIVLSLLSSRSCGSIAHGVWQTVKLDTALRREHLSLCICWIEGKTHKCVLVTEITMAQVLLPSHGKTKTGWKFWGCPICWGQKSK